MFEYRKTFFRYNYINANQNKKIKTNKNEYRSINI